MPVYKKAMDQSGLDLSTKQKINQTKNDLRITSQGIAGDNIEEGVPNFLQTSSEKVISNKTALVKYLTRKMDLYIAPKLSSYSGSWSTQRDLAIQEDKYASKIDEIITETQLNIDQLSYMPVYIKHLADSFVNIQKVKYGTSR